jgi:hypothetical protein
MPTGQVNRGGHREGIGIGQQHGLQVDRDLRCPPRFMSIGPGDSARCTASFGRHVIGDDGLLVGGRGG